MTNNPFIQKADERKVRQKEIAERNFRELQKIFFSFKPGNSKEARERIRNRLKEADEIHKLYS